MTLKNSIMTLLPALIAWFSVTISAAHTPDPVNPEKGLELVVQNLADGEASAIRFYSSDTTLKVGDEFCTDIRVDGFNKVLILQFSLRWDSSRLEFLSAEPLTLPFNHSFGVPDPPLIPENTLTFSGDAIDPVNGETLDDGTALFRLCFKVKKASRDCIQLSFEDEPVPLEFVNANFNNIGITDDLGDVCIPPDGPDRYSRRDADIFIEGQHNTSIDADKSLPATWEAPSDNQPTSFTAYPNPVNQTVQIQLPQEASIAGPIRIADARGVTIKSVAIQDVLNGNTLHINVQDISRQGMYFCQLPMADGSLEIVRFIKH